MVHSHIHVPFGKKTECVHTQILTHTCWCAHAHTHTHTESLHMIELLSRAQYWVFLTFSWVGDVLVPGPVFTNV